MEAPGLTALLVTLALCAVVIVVQVLCNVFVALDQAAAF